MKKLFLLFILAAFPMVGFSQTNDEKPHWSFEFKGGDFKPTLEDWSDFYGKDKMRQFNVSLAYKLLRQVEVGMDVGYRRDKGEGRLEISGKSGGDVVYENYPVGLFVVLRGVFNENQWLVPYIGAGLNRVYYKTEIKNQESVSGKMNGYTARAGVQLLLDVFDKSAAHNAKTEYGWNNTYLVLEVQKSKVKESSDWDIGGKFYSAGLLFEF